MNSTLLLLYTLKDFFKSILKMKVIYPRLFRLVKVFKLTKLLISSN